MELDCTIFPMNPSARMMATEKKACQEFAEFSFKNIFYVVHRTAYNDAVFFYSGVLRHNGLRINGGHTKECADPHPENCTRSSGSNGRGCAGNVSRTYLRCNAVARA